MRSAARFLIIFILLLLAPCVTSAQKKDHHPAPPGKPRLATDLSPRYYPYKDHKNFPNRLLAKLNAIRQQHDLPPLRMSSSLSDVAQAHSTDMYLRNFVDHVSPDNEDHTGRLARLKPRLLTLQAKENLAWYESTFLLPEEMLIDKEFEGLMNSPSHRAAILSDDVFYVGFGFTTFWNGDRFESNQVQLFADIVGEWRQNLPDTIHPGQTLELVLTRPIDAYLASESDPRGQFPDPQSPNKHWIGGLPIPFETKAQTPTIKIPNVPEGNYRIQCSPKDANRYVVVKRVRVERG